MNYSTFSADMPQEEVEAVLEGERVPVSEHGGPGDLPGGVSWGSLLQAKEDQEEEGGHDL